MEELLRKLNDVQVRYVVIGGQAMLQEGMPRFTLDWDLIIPPFDLDNFAKLNSALSEELPEKVAKRVRALVESIKAMDV